MHDDFQKKDVPISLPLAPRPSDLPNCRASSQKGRLKQKAPNPSEGIDEVATWLARMPRSDGEVERRRHIASWSEF